MTNATRDENNKPVILGTSSVDNSTPIPIKINPVTGRVLISVNGGGTGDVIGPGVAVDENLAIFDGTTGKLIKDGLIGKADIMKKSVYDTSNIAKDLFTTSKNIYVDETKGDDVNGNGSTNAPFATIPVAIAASTSNTSILVAPGTYSDNITLTSNIVSIRASGIRALITGKIICNGTHFFQNLSLRRLGVTTSETQIDMVTNVSTIIVDFCELTLTTSIDDIQPKIVDYGGGSNFQLLNSDVTYTNSSTAANSSITGVIQGTGTGYTVINGVNFYLDISQSSGDVYSIIDDTSGIFSSVMMLPLINTYHASYSGCIGHYKGTEAGYNKRLAYSEYIITGNGSGTGEVYNLDSSAGSQTVRSINNTINVSGFTNNYHANVVNATDTLKTFNDESNALDGVIGNGTYQQDPLWDFYNGTIEELIDFQVASNGTVITGSLQKSGGGNLTLRTTKGRLLHVCAPDTVTLTAGLDTAYQTNYIYIDITDNILKNSTTGFPLTEHARIARVECQSAATMNTDGFSRTVQYVNDSISDPDDNGHMSHINEWLREQFATYKSGMAQGNTGSGTATVNLSMTSGVMLQAHKNNSPAYSSPADFYVTNDSVTANLKLTNLASILLDSTGSTLNNTYFSLVLWQDVGSIANTSTLNINLPSGSYLTEANAREDTSKYTNFSIGSNKNTGILIHRYICRTSGGVLTIYPGDGDDIRGQVPGNVAGTSTTVATQFFDGSFEIQNTADNTKVIKLDASNITTGNDRTITMPDEDVTISNAEDTTTMGVLINGADAKVTPVDTDLVPIRDVTGGLLEKVTWANIKATIKTYYDSVTTTFTNKTFDANGTGNSLSNVDVADLADGTDGELITWAADGTADTVAVGTAGQVLTSNGVGVAPTFQAAAGGGGGSISLSALAGSTDGTEGAIANGAGIILSASATNTLYLNWIIPDGGVTISSIKMIRSSDSNSGNAWYGFNSSITAAGESSVSGGETDSIAAAAYAPGSTSWDLVSTDVTAMADGLTLNGGEWLGLQIRRFGADGSDTLTTASYIMGLDIVYS